MHATLDLLRRERRARLFFLVYAQSALGTGAGYVALVVLAYQRWHSPWAITLVLVADFVPAMVLGPVFGALADRWSRRRVAIAADALRAVAFVAIGLTGGIWATIGLALLAGVGAGLFTPAMLAAIPSLVDDERRLPAATSLYGSLGDLGRTTGPALAALALVLAGPETVVVANGLTFAVSALVLAGLRFGAAPERAPGQRQSGILAEAREGVVAVAGMPRIRAIVLASSGLIMFAAMLNVAELLLARHLGSGSSGYSVLVAAGGLGFVAGSLAGAGGAPIEQLRRRYLLGILATAIGIAGLGLASTFAVAVPAMLLSGIGNGLALVHERLIFQRVIPDSLMARAFAIVDAAGSWAFGFAFVAAGLLLSQIGVQAVLVLAGSGVLAVWAAAAWALRGAWSAQRRTPIVATPVQAATES